jgi:phosphatidylglycerophosphatase A
LNRQPQNHSEPFSLAKVVASFFYVGYVPVIPGTFGSLATFPLYFLLVCLGGWQVYLAVLVAVIVAGVAAADRAEKQSRIIDPSFVVIDEVAGQLTTLFLLPVSWKTAFAGFLLFRILDIIKPFPAGRAERLHGGWGIMMDDVIAGVYGNLLIRLVLFVFHISV